MVEVVGAAGDRGAKCAGGDFPAGEAVVGVEERAIQCEDGGGIGKVDGFPFDGVVSQEGCQIGTEGDQVCEIVACTVGV